MEAERNLTLAIETAIAGGSVSILKGKNEIDFWIGNNEISKAEDVLENISRLFKRNEIKKESIAAIIVPNDIGSTTGLKIGLATAKGLAKAFACRLETISLLHSLAELISLENGVKGAVALPVGKNNIYRQYLCGGKPSGDSTVIKRDVFIKELKEFQGKYYLHQNIFQLQLQENEFTRKSERFINLGENIASIFGKTPNGAARPITS